eukprot:10449374-Alexandrium_andersonii.AAC.1
MPAHGRRRLHGQARNTGQASTPDHDHCKHRRQTLRVMGTPLVQMRTPLERNHCGRDHSRQAETTRLSKTTIDNHAALLVRCVAMCTLAYCISALVPAPVVRSLPGNLYGSACVVDALAHSRMC